MYAVLIDNLQETEEREEKKTNSKMSHQYVACFRHGPFGSSNRSGGKIPRTHDFGFVYAT